MRVLKVHNSTRIHHSEEDLTVTPPPPDAITLFSIPAIKGKRKPIKQAPPRKLVLDKYMAEYSLKEVTVDFIIKCLKHESTYRRWMLDTSEAYTSSAINQSSDLVVLKRSVAIFGGFLQ